ncbi:MAG: hypothetical protein N2Z81_04870 [Hydrogenothermaceae bacterium]|nr:hypothetical protein [Hydrogenothermaceae bacterium]
MRVKAKRVKEGFLIPLIKGFEDKEEIEVEIELLSKEQLDDEFVDKHWKALALDTVSGEREDDEIIYEAAWRFYNEKHGN